MTNTVSDMPVSHMNGFIKDTFRNCSRRIRCIHATCVNADAKSPRTTESATVLTESDAVSMNANAEHSAVGIPISAPIMGYFTFPQE